MGAGASLLSVAGHPRATAVFLDEDEAFDLPAERLDNTTSSVHSMIAGFEGEMSAANE